MRSKAPRFAAASGPQSGTCGNGTVLKLLALGDSIVAGVGARTLDRALVGQTALALAESLDTRVEWSAIGKIGYTCARVESLIPIEPGSYAFVLVSVGVNDITALTSETRFRRDLISLYRALDRFAPNAIIAFCGIPPLAQFPALPQPLRAVFGLRAARFDQILRETLISLPRAVHIPVDFAASEHSFAADGFHPSEESYVEFGRAAANAFVQRQGEFTGPPR